MIIVECDECKKICLQVFSLSITQYRADDKHYEKRISQLNITLQIMDTLSINDKALFCSPECALKRVTNEIAKLTWGL